MSDDNQTIDPEKVEAEKLPNVRAFEDEFTRGFLQSIKETKEGYYPFLSQTSNYEMNFPAGGVIDERGYFQQNGTEKFSIGHVSNEFNARINIKYFGFMKSDSMDSRLQTIKENSDTPLQFQQKDLPGRTLQKAFYKDDLGYFGYVAMIQNSENSGAVEISTVSECKENAENCNQIIEDTKTTISKWLESIKFRTKTGSE
ncbi:hypothetical protein JI666_13650 [Bacillus sp. NTK071]|uniref:hypothetical protein n=1 Tax=Bacillus sp. NTK071 TaxID=2802175 RepID=UPI001A8E6D08|nr:hypothetical protein [Bacillus sp. NTK071]MBN8209796.1 hypothetical protein [Bacillus sp. NTK071]